MTGNDPVKACGLSQEQESDPLLRGPGRHQVSKLIEEKNKRIEVEQENKLLESTIAEYEPKINYLDIILESEDTVTVSQIAQDYGMTARQFNKLLNELKVRRHLGNQLDIK